MASKGVGTGDCLEHGEYFLDSEDSPCPSCEDDYIEYELDVPEVSCDACADSGLHDCHGCDGTGEQLCDCDGYGCDLCSEDGMQSCWTCEGSGVQECDEC